MEPPTKVTKWAEPLATDDLPSSDEVITERDLPLLANIHHVRVHHYLMKLSTDFSRRVISGSVIVFLEWLTPTQTKIIFDQCFLKINRVVSLRVRKEYDVSEKLSAYDGGSGNRRNFYWSSKEIDWFSDLESAEHLTFTQSKWSLTIQGWSENIPSVLKIDYETLVTSPSIHWRPCDGFDYQNALSKCCYTPAPAVNNRGLFPCQEAPSAVATWEVLLECDKEYLPLLTSDEPGEIIGHDNESSRLIHYFYCSIPLPMSTFALVIGKFYHKTTLIPPLPSETKLHNNSVEPIVKKDGLTEDDITNYCTHHSKYPCRFGDVAQQQETVVSVRLFNLDPDTALQDLGLLTNLVFSSLEAGFKNFGPHPCSRLDIVVVPKSYPHEGLASPSMMFLSCSNFYGVVEPLYICRLPHEICHNWFGLLIGSLDWTEEWLSEGFATYCEDVLFPTAFQTYFPAKSQSDIERDHALKILMRFTSLQAELRNTASEKELHVISSGNSQQNSQTALNGLVPIKQFMSVHYYKGYLLIWHLTFLVGQQEFLKFLRKYVWRYHGQLVSSEIFLDCYYSHFGEILRHQNCDSTSKLKTDWLQSNALPEPYDSLNFLEDDNLTRDSVPLLFSNALEPLKNIKKLYKTLLVDNDHLGFNLENLSCSELLLLLELILNPDLARSEEQRNNLKKNYFQHFTTSPVFLDVEKRHNADVAHRWCELIILFKDKSRLCVVANFLRNNIAMGVYLYGELMISELYSFQKVAKQLYYELENVYDLATKKILKEMLF